MRRISPRANGSRLMRSMLGGSGPCAATARLRTVRTTSATWGATIPTGRIPARFSTD